MKGLDNIKWTIEIVEQGPLCKPLMYPIQTETSHAQEKSDITWLILSFRSSSWNHNTTKLWQHQSIKR